MTVPAWCPSVFADGIIGNAVQICDVPNAVRSMMQLNATGSAGKALCRVKPSQKTGQAKQVKPCGRR